MKALSIKEPWASMIRDRRKTIETRIWRTDYRGLVLLCASKKPNGPLVGMAFAYAQITECRPMKKNDEEAAYCSVYPGAFSWFLEHVYIIRPFPVRGRLGLFDVEYPVVKHRGKTTNEKYSWLFGYQNPIFWIPKIPKTYQIEDAGKTHNTTHELLNREVHIKTNENGHQKT